MKLIYLYLNFAHFGLPSADSQKEWSWLSVNLMNLPHEISSDLPPVENTEIDFNELSLLKEDIERFDKIYAMAGDIIDEMKDICGASYNGKKVDLLLNEVFPGENRDVPDPWSGPESGYYEAYDLIEEACEKIIEVALLKRTGV